MTLEMPGVPRQPWPFDNLPQTAETVHARTNVHRGEEEVSAEKAGGLVDLGDILSNHHA